jgi:CheY-like chemotaxis protein
MRVLVLDDDPARLKAFVQSLIGHTVVTVSFVKDCIENLQNESWDLLFLDHDLSGQAYVPSGPGTGYEVAEWLRDNPDKKPKKIILHTFNQLGAVKMREVLPEAQYVPGAWLVSWEHPS